MTGYNQRLGKCYQLSGRYILSRNDMAAKLVHGTITNLDKSKTIDHAWIESGENVIDLVLEWKVPKDAYYRFLSVVVKNSYDSDTALKIMAKTGHFGPWKENEYVKSKHKVDSKIRRNYASR